MVLVAGGGHGGGHGCCGGGVSSGGHGSAGSGLYSETIEVVVGKDGEKVEVVVALMVWVMGVDNVVVVVVVAIVVVVVVATMVMVVVTMVIFCFLKTPTLFYNVSFVMPYFTESKEKIQQSKRREG